VLNGQYIYSKTKYHDLNRTQTRVQTIHVTLLRLV